MSKGLMNNGLTTSEEEYYFQKGYQQGRADAERDFQNTDYWADYLAKVIADAKADAIEEIYNKLDEGVCDICEHKAFDDKCYLNCRHEVENAKRWLLGLKEQK